MNRNLILLICTLVLVSACSQQEFTSNDQQKFDAFLKIKRIAANDTARVDRIREEYERRAALASAVYESGKLDKVSMDAEIEEFRKELLISRYFETYLNEAVTDEGIKNFYSQNVENYRSRKVKVSHILFRVTPRMTEIERQAVLTKASEAHSKLTSGEDFVELAKTISEDKVSGKKGGSLGWVNEGAVSVSFSEKVFSMKAGELSEPFLTDFGYHLIKLDEEAQEVTNPLEALKGDIRYQLRNKSKKAEIERLLNSVSYKAD